MQKIEIESYFKGFRRLYDFARTANHPQIGIAEKRVKIIEFFEKYGDEATKEAFGVSRSTVYLWKKRLRDSQGKIISLVPESKAPKKRRERKTSPEIIQFILNYRKEHPRVGKETIKPKLDELSVNTSYEIYIYKDVTPVNSTSGPLSATKSETLSTRGYPTVVLSSPVPLY